MSRVQRLEQLFLMDELPEEKIYASTSAMMEIERLLDVSVNNNPNEWEDKDVRRTRISFLNCRSIKNKFQHIESDMSLKESDIMFLCETWLEKDQDLGKYELENYSACFVGKGRGKGLACYYKSKFGITHKIFNKECCLISAESEKYIVIGTYRFGEGLLRSFVNILENQLKIELKKGKIVIVGGDMNICASSKPGNILSNMLMELGFVQKVRSATHVDGGLIDHVYVYDAVDLNVATSLEHIPKYYSDHDCLGLSIWDGDKIVMENGYEWVD